MYKSQTRSSNNNKQGSRGCRVRGRWLHVWVVSVGFSHNGNALLKGGAGNTLCPNKNTLLKSCELIYEALPTPLDTYFFKLQEGKIIDDAVAGRSCPNGKHGHNSGAYADGHHLHRRPRARQGLLQAPPREREGEVLRLSTVVHLVADHLHTDVRERTCRRGLPVSLGVLFR